MRISVSDQGALLGSLERAFSSGGDVDPETIAENLDRDGYETIMNEIEDDDLRITAVEVKSIHVDPFGLMGAVYDYTLDVACEDESGDAEDEGEDDDEGDDEGDDENEEDEG